MAELAMLTDMQRTVYPEDATLTLNVIAQGKESSPIIDQRSNQLGYATKKTLTGSKF